MVMRKKIKNFLLGAPCPLTVALWIFAFSMSLVFVTIGTSRGLEMMNQSSDVSVALGFSMFFSSILLFMITSWFIGNGLMEIYYQCIKKEVEEKREFENAVRALPMRGCECDCDGECKTKQNSKTVNINE